MTSRRESDPDSTPDVRELTANLRAANAESGEQIAESRRLSKDSGKRLAAQIKKIATDPPIEE